MLQPLENETFDTCASHTEQSPLLGTRTKRTTRAPPVGRRTRRPPWQRSRPPRIAPRRVRCHLSWLLVADTDNFLRSTAGKDAGRGLSRLLNVTDGLLGQAENTLVLLTTNEDLARLHPAIIRPGRCLASIEITRFPKADADQWLTRHGAKLSTRGGGTTLAELYARTERHHATTDTDDGNLPMTEPTPSEATGPLTVANTPIEYQAAVEIIAGYCFGKEALKRKTPPIGAVGPEWPARKVGAFAYRTYDCIAPGAWGTLEPIDVLVANGLNAGMRASAIGAVIIVADEISDELKGIPETQTFWDLPRDDIIAAPAEGPARHLWRLRPHSDRRPTPEPAKVHAGANLSARRVVHRDAGRSDPPL